MQQHNQEAPVLNFEHLPDLPARITMRDGQVIDVADYVWRMTLSADLPTPLTINWNSVLNVTISETSMQVMSTRAINLVRLFVIEKMSGVKAGIKPRSARNYYEATLNLARWLAVYPEWLSIDRSFEWSDMTEDLFNAWLNSEYQTNRKGQLASLLRRFYQWGTGKSFPDFSMLLASVLGNLNIKGNVVGEIVASRDSRRGPFTHDEMDLILGACEAGEGNDHDRAITWTLLDTAIRPEQMFLLKNRDLILRDTAYGDVTDGSPLRHKYWLRVRIIKQRNSHPQYQSFPLSEGCFQLLDKLSKPESGPEGRLFWWLGKCFTSYINERLKAFFKAVNLRSPRLPIENPSPEGPFYELMPVNPYRFRYGMATDRIAQGDTEENVSRALCHTNKSSVHIYVETSPLIADDFQRATDYAILPLIRRMEGQFSDDVELMDVHPTASGKRDPVYEPVATIPAVRGDSKRQLQYRRSVEEFELPAEKSKVETRLNEMIASARRRFPQLYPGQNFDDQVWEIIHLKERPSTSRTKRLGFTTLASTKHSISHNPADALPAYFANVVKSWLMLGGHVSVSFNLRRLNSARHFWNFLSERRTLGEAFKWNSLIESDFFAFEQHLRDYKSASTKKQLGTDTILGIIVHIQCLVDFLASRGICRRIDYISHIISQREASIQLLEARELAAEEKLPAPGVLEALADIYYRLTTAPAGSVSDFTLILISAVAILMMTGIRLGELLTLPFDCEIDEKIPAKEPGEADSYRFGLRYWVEKTRKKTKRVKWISPTAEPVVRAAVQRIKDLTAEARQRAKILENNPDEVPLPADVANLPMITRQQLISLLDFEDGSHLSRLSCEKLPRQVIDGRIYYRIEDVKVFIFSKRVRELYTFRCDSTVQMLSESLFVVFVNQSDFRRGSKCNLLVEPIRAKSVSRFLSREINSSSSSFTAFSEFGLTEKERALKTTPHALRHWLTDVAHKGGMSWQLLLRYFEKKSDSDIQDYIHSVPDEAGPYVPEDLRADYTFV
jgi:hypothetical protein